VAKFRFAVSLGKYADRARPFKRPPMPAWIQRIGARTSHSSRYWSNIYWATLPWVNDEQVAEMIKLHDNCDPATHHLDHIVPLESNLVCGLHVPWNMQKLTCKENLSKSNKWWPGHPNEDLTINQIDLFGDL